MASRGGRRYTVFKGVNEDTQVTYLTYKDDVLLMVSYSDDSGMWKEELAKILCVEQEKVKTQCMVRMSNWLQTRSMT